MMLQSLVNVESITSIGSFHPSERFHLRPQSIHMPHDVSLPDASRQGVKLVSDARKRSRNRGVVLSQKGWQKLVEAEVLHDSFGRRYTFEQLSERSLLDVRTVSRLLSCEAKVDKSTMRTFFRSFNLSLDADDYTKPRQREISHTDTKPTFADPKVVDSVISTVSNSGMVAPELLPLIEELLQLKQYLMEERNHLMKQLGLSEPNYTHSQASN